MPENESFLTVPLGWHPHRDAKILPCAMDTRIAFLQRLSAVKESRQIVAADHGTPR